MIKREELVKIGRFNKPHGIKGEISFSFTDDIFEESECQSLICELDGIFVPFPIEHCRFTSDVAAFVKLKRIDSEIKAKQFMNLEVYFPKELIEKQLDSSEISSWNYFLGYTLIDESAGTIGIIKEVDETTINTLFILERAGEEIMIPAAEDFILEIDTKNKVLHVSLPEGLLD